MTEVMNTEGDEGVFFESDLDEGVSLEVNPSHNSRANLFNRNVQNFMKHYGVESNIKIVNDVLKLIMRWLGNTSQDVSNISTYASAYFIMMRSIDINNENCYRTLEMKN